MKTKRYLLIGIVFIILFSACNKRDEVFSGTNPGNQAEQRLPSSLENANNEADERMNTDLFMLANGLRSFANDQDKMNIIYGLAGLNEDGQIKYDDLIAADAGFLSKINTYLKPNYYADSSSITDCYNYIKTNMVVSGITYYPELYIPNINTANLDSLPIICIGAEIDNDDKIIGYRVFTNGSFAEGAYSEAQALASARPVIIMANGTETIDQTSFPATPDTTITSNLPSVQSTFSPDFSWKVYQVKAGYSYESPNSNTELYYLLTLQKVGLSPSYMQNQNGFGNDGIFRRMIVSITPGDVALSHPFTTLTDLFPMPVDSAFAETYDTWYITVYEHDWYATKKVVSVCNYDLAHKPKMKYAHEWYVNNICSAPYITFFPVANQNVGYGASNAKFTYTITRTQ